MVSFLNLRGLALTGPNTRLTHRMLHRIHKGLDLPIAGAPVQTITAGPRITRVALMADDFPGLKPRVRVTVGQEVRRGELLCEDGGTPGVRHTAPGATTNGGSR